MPCSTRIWACTTGRRLALYLCSPSPTLGLWVVVYLVSLGVRIGKFHRIFQKTFRYLWRFYSLLFRGFFVVFSWLFRGPLLSRNTVFGPFSWLFRGFFVAFSWLFRGPRFGQILRVLALEQSSEFFTPETS